jgi:hypothetical protein
MAAGDLADQGRSRRAVEVVVVVVGWFVQGRAGAKREMAEARLTRSVPPWGGRKTV